jgi:predicted MPP superfamily phosphohydrolase
VMTPVPFYIFRWVGIALAVFAQVYLYARIRRAIRSASRSERAAMVAVLLTGTLIGLLFVMNWVVMFRPIPWVYPPTAAQAVFFYPPAVWGLGSIFSALILLVTAALGRLWRQIARMRTGSQATQASGPAGIDRRRLLRLAVGAAAGMPFVLSGYGAACVGRSRTVEEISLPFGAALRVVQLTDIHAGLYMTREQIRRYVDEVIALDPEVFALTGDYISNATAFFPGFVAEMARVRARYGTFATLGNHEHWYGRLPYFQALFNAHGIHLLQNAHRVVRGTGGAFAIAGIDDLRSGRPDLPAALDGWDPRLPMILLSHRPEIFPEAAARGIALTLSGHYHGGQIKLSLPGGDFSLAHLRTPYPEGLYRRGASRLYVSRGIGTTFTPVRLNAPPEVTLFLLT